MYISYDHYRIFYYVAKYRSFTQAANVLLNNQPNITRAIKTLEGELGCKLFVRSNRGVTLTPEGEKLYKHISLAIHHIEAAENELLQDKGLQNGCISIGASEVALHCFLLPVLKKYKETYPGVRIRVSNHSTPQAMTALKEGFIDFAVVTTPVDVPKTAKMTVLKMVQETAVCGNAYSFLAGKELTLEELTNYPIICLGNQTKTYTFYTELFAKHGFTLKPDIEAATADQILPLVKNNLGIGFVPEEFIESEDEKSSIYRLQMKEKIPPRSICLIKGTEYGLSVAADKLEKMLLLAAESS